jgi:hypothetical protein
MARVGHNGVEAHPLDYVPRHRSPNALPSSDPDVSEPDASVERLLAGVVPAKRQRDARTMLDLMARVTGQAPKVDRNAAGFGSLLPLRERPRRHRGCRRLRTAQERARRVRGQRSRRPRRPSRAPRPAHHRRRVHLPQGPHTGRPRHPRADHADVLRDVDGRDVHTPSARGWTRLTTHGSRSTPTARGMGRVEQSPPLT